MLDDLSSGHRSNIPEGTVFIEGSVAGPEETLRTAMQGVQAVFHLAAEVSVPRTVEAPQRSFEVNMAGSEAVFRTASACGVASVVFASSAAVYGPEPALPSRERDPLRCVSPYAAHKASGELLLSAYARCFGMHAASLRFFNVFGPRQDPRSAYAAVISAFMDAAIAGRTPKVFGDGLQTRDFVPVANVVQGLRRAADPRRGLRGEAFNIGLGERRSLLDLLAALGRLLGVDLAPEFHPPRAGDVPHSQASIERAVETLGYRPEVSFEEGLRRTVEWARAVATRA